MYIAVVGLPIFWALAQELGDGGNEDLLYAMRRQVLAAVGVVA